MNRRGEKPDTLEEGGKVLPPKPIDLAAQDDLHRLDKKKKKKKKKPARDHNGNKEAAHGDKKE
jgi:hypothetical protein